MDLQLKIVSQTTSTITLGWTPPPECFGYVYYVNNKRVSNTWDPTVKQVRFHKVDGAVYKVVALKINATGVYPPGTPTNSEAYSVDPYSIGVYSH